MAVYIELVMEDTDRVARNLAKRKGRRAGEANVRRPTRGLEIKEDTYATIRVIRSDGSEIALFDSSDSTGRSTKYANFLLQSVQEARMEKQQILETFGEPILMLMGEAPRFLDVSAMLLNSHDFNWRAEWWQNYETYLRGTKLVERGARMYLCYDDLIVEGYMIQAQASESSMEPLLVQLSFRMFVTNATNTTIIGDPNFPIRDSLNLPEGVDVTSASAYDKLGPKKPGAYPKPGEMASEVFTTYLKQVGALQIQEQIKNAASLEHAQALQKQYLAQQLGLANDPNLLADAYSGAKDFLNDWKKGGPAAAFKGLGQKVVDAGQDVGNQIVDGLQPKEDPKFNEKQEYVLLLLELGMISKFTVQNGSIQYQAVAPDKEAYARRILAERKARFYAQQFAAQFSLSDVLRRGQFYSTPYPGQNIADFLKNASLMKYQTNQPPPWLTRTLPLRSRIADNLDEYTSPGSAITDAQFDFRNGKVGSAVKNPLEVLDKQVCQRGGALDPKAYYALGMVSWKPGGPLAINYGTGSVQGPGLGIGQSAGAGGTGNGPVHAVVPGQGGYVLGLGNGFRPTFSRVPGGTASVAGAYGGAMGGSIGPGVGGALGGYGAYAYNTKGVYQYGNPLQQQLAQSPFGPGGDPYGLGFGSFAGHPSLAPLYTGGYNPDGSPIGGNGFTTPGLFGGGPGYKAAASLGSKLRGKGMFSTQAIPGTLTSGKSCGPVTSTLGA